MKRLVFVFLMAGMRSGTLFSQDIITLNNGDIIQSKIIEIGQTDVRYRRFENQSGPVYVLSKPEIAMIVYENGIKDVFNSKKIIITGNPSSTDSKISEESLQPAEDVSGSRFRIGFSGIYPTGTWPATALSNMGTTSFLKSQGHNIKSYGLGVLVQYNISKNISLFLDGNTYNYNIFLAEQGEDVQSVWTVAESAIHWDEPGAPQILYVHNLPTDVHFDMQTTGFRLGVKYYMLNKKIRPWIGAGFGFYEWEANYYNESKDQTYGSDRDFVTGITFLGGIDFEPVTGLVIALFADLASPVANYQMEGLFYPQWDIDYESHIMGTSRLGLTISFDASKSKK